MDFESENTKDVVRNKIREPNIKTNSGMRFCGNSEHEDERCDVRLKQRSREIARAVLEFYHLRKLIEEKTRWAKKKRRRTRSAWSCRCLRSSVALWSWSKCRVEVVGAGANWKKKTVGRKKYVERSVLEVVGV